MADADDSWRIGDLDLRAYLRRVGDEGPLDVSEATLRRLHRAHALSIPFENLDVMLGRGVDIELGAIQAKLVAGGRGGYCYEHNLLFAAVLERLGFPVTRLAARVRMSARAEDRPGDRPAERPGERPEVRPRTHMVLAVRVDGMDLLADVGFGGESLLEPVPLHDGAESIQGAWRFRVDRVHSEQRGTEYVVRSRHPDGWFDLYAFTREPQFPADYLVANHFVATHPRSPFTGRPVVLRPGDRRRTALVGTRLTVTTPDGESGRDIDPAELGDILLALGLDLPEDDVRRLTGRL